MRYKSTGHVTFAETQETGLPEPVPYPETGWFVFAYDGQHPARARHDKIPRTLGLPISQTNETVVMRPIADGKVDWRSKEITQLDRRWEWVEKFISMMGEYIWGQYKQNGFGFQDTGPYKQQSLTCGGNLLNTVGDRLWAKDGAYVQLEILDFFSQPPVEDWDDAPHLMTKQVLVGNDIQKNPYYIVDQKRGDITWPMVCDRPLAIKLTDIEYLPTLPFYTTMNGVPIVIQAYCFQGSKTFGNVDGEWYLLEEMIVTGAGSCTYDRVVYVSDWIETCPPPIKGWTAQGNSLLDKLRNIIKKISSLI